MHSNIVNGRKLLCDAYTVPEQDRGTAALFVLLSYFFAISFYMFVTLTVPFHFLGASIVCVRNNVKRAEDLVLWFPE